MDLIDLPNIRNWINQFEYRDRYLAEYMLRRLRYISFEDFETWLQQEVKNLIMHIGKEPIALFPVTKPENLKYSESKAYKPKNDSSGRIAHILKNFERSSNNYIELTPRIVSMRSKKVRHIIYVDDYIGTGERFIKFWRNDVSSSIKSWCSFGWCKIWVLSFAAHKQGIRKIVNKIKCVKHEQIKVGLDLGKSFIHNDKDLLNFCNKYTSDIFDSDKNNSLARDENNSFGNLLSPIIFQHGCPNNAPLILWGKKNKPKKWNPLFPGRSIPDCLYKLFNRDFNRDFSYEATAEDLWKLNRHKLAINFLDNPNIFYQKKDHLCVLTCIQEKKTIQEIKNKLTMSEANVNQLLKDLKSYGLVDSIFQITDFGRELLIRIVKLKTIDKELINQYKYYYPSSFLGFQREI